MNIAFFKKLRPAKWMFKVEKRIRFVISTLVLSTIMLISTLFFFDRAFIFIPIFIVACFGLTYFSILEGIEKNEWLMLFIMPVLFTVFAYIFYFLFPVRWLTRIPFISIYAVSMYAILLTSNIFNVGVEKNLQLYRAAFSINYFYQTLIIFLFFNALLSLRESFLINAIGSWVVIFPLSLQFFWSIKLDLKLERRLVLFAVLISLIISQTVLILSFVPLDQTVLALMLTASYYSLAGLSYSYIDSRLFKETVREYFIVLIFVFLIGLLTIKW